MAAELIAKLRRQESVPRVQGYPGHICVSVNEEVVHGIPSKRRVQYGDIVSLDVGIVLDGFVGDNATTVAVGVVAPRTQQLLRVTEQALYAGIAAARRGQSRGRYFACGADARLKRRGFRWCGSLWDTESGGRCTKSRRFRITGGPETGRS